MSRRHLILGALLLLAVAVAVVWTTHPRLLRAMARWLDVGEPPQPAECVMVLNGAEDTRPFAAAALLKAGFARHALVARVSTTTWVPHMMLSPCDETNRQVLLKCGVPQRDITILPGEAESTYDEAQALATFLRDRPKTRVLVVTSDCHTRRSRWVFARALGDQAAQVSFVSAPTDEFRMDCWWQDELGFVTIVTEYFKLFFYVIYYGHLGYWLAACGALALVARRMRCRWRTLALPIDPELSDQHAEGVAASTTPVSEEPMNIFATLLVKRTDNLITQFLRYLVVGGVAFVVDFTVLIGLTELAGVNYLLSAAAGFLFGLIANYVLSISWVFQNRTLKNKQAEFSLFAIIGIIGLGLNELILYVGTDMIGFDYRVSKLIAVAIVLFWNFGARKATLFRAG
jgi:putative flippase GtrA/uncharacterized SAM-binding protein YcdF (DUF218 family)